MSNTETETATDQVVTEGTVGVPAMAPVTAAGKPAEEVEEVAAAVAAPKPTTRDGIRAKIFSAKPDIQLVEDFYGTDIELRQPSLSVALETRNGEEKDYVFSMLLDYAYVPGTSEKVFTEEDIEALRELPFGPSMTSLLEKVNKLLGIDGAAIEEMLKDATKSPEA